MADNITTTAGVIAAKDFSDVLYPRNILSVTIGGVATDVTKSNPLPVEVDGLESAQVDFDIAPHDTNPLTIVPRSIYIGGGGDLVVRLPESSSDRTYKSLPAGYQLPISPEYVRASGTTATYLVGMGRLGGDD